MYIVRQEEKNILSYVDFVRLCNVINQYPCSSINILTNGIAFPISYSSRAFKQVEDVITGLDEYVKQIDTSIYGDYITTICFVMIANLKDEVV